VRWLGLVTILAGRAHANGCGVSRPGGGHRTPTARSVVAGAGSSVMGPRQGLHGEHREGSGVVPGKVAEGGAHMVRPSTVRWWEGALAAVLDDGNRAPVAGDEP
jgi:hypothetical protein